MAGFKYLWNNRVRLPFGSFAFFKTWAKRILLIRSTTKRNIRRAYLNTQGANIHECAEISDTIINGRKSNLTVGAFTFIGKANLALHDRIVIGERVCINDGVHLLTASHDVNDPQWQHVKAPIIIDDFAWICTSAIILSGVHIGKGAVVGAGAIVSKDVKDWEIVVGNPAKAITKKRNSNLKYNPCGFLAANKAWLEG
ncbi:acyltransferase [Telluribacter humicola]|uniref:acyltransferase n=1 Tax=Telluribacter humicola TaxID=1720261 RepID=UPI001A97929A|nr:hypothetical protein [Telluribacter humicola]